MDRVEIVVDGPAVRVTVDRVLVAELGPRGWRVLNPRGRWDSARWGERPGDEEDWRQFAAEVDRRWGVVLDGNARPEWLKR